MSHIRKTVDQILEEAIENIGDAPEELEDLDGDGSAANELLEIILSSLKDLGVTRGRISKFKGGGWRAPISHGQHIFWITTKEA